MQRSGRPLPCRTNIVARSHRAASFIRHLASHLLNAPWKTPATFPCQIATWPLLATAVAHRPHEAPTEAGGMLPRSLATLPALMHLLHALKKNSTAARCRGKKTLTPTARPAHAGPHCKGQSSKVKGQKIVLRGKHRYNTCRLIGLKRKSSACRLPTNVL